jgi:hypothetical protein
VTIIRGPSGLRLPEEARMTAIYPQKVTLALALELNVESDEAAAYIFAQPATGSTEIQLGLIADLFDVLGYHTDLQVLSINNLTLTEVQKKISQGL